MTQPTKSCIPLQSERVFIIFRGRSIILRICFFIHFIRLWNMLHNIFNLTVENGT